MAALEREGYGDGVVSIDETKYCLQEDAFDEIHKTAEKIYKENFTFTGKLAKLIKRLFS